MSQEKRKASPWLKAFVLFHIFAITVWAIPEPPENIRNGKVSPQGSDYILLWNWNYLKTTTGPVTIQPILSDYVLCTGFWQYWDMFAPNPASADFYGDGIVKYKDGTEKLWNYPRIEKMPIPEKFMMERYRKFFERVRLDDNAFLWATFAQRVAEEMDADPKNPPVNVRLRRNWIEVQPPDRTQWTKYNSYFFYDYTVDQVELAQARKSK